MKTRSPTLLTKLADAIIHPQAIRNPAKNRLAWAATIILGIFTLGGIQLIAWTILKATKTPRDKAQSAKVKKASQPILVKKSPPAVLLPPLKKKMKSSVPTFEEASKNPTVREIYQIYKQLTDEPRCAGWLDERINLWKLDLNLVWSEDYLEDTRKYLTNLLKLKGKSEQEREILFDRGIRAREALRSERKLKEILTGEVWYQDDIGEMNLLVKAAMLPVSKRAIPLLLEVGVDPNQRDDQGNTALHWAVANAAVECAMILIQLSPQHPINFDAQDWGWYGMTPLQLAIAKGPRASNWDALITQLITNTKDLNKQNKKGNSALHLACVRRDLPLAQALIAKGADITLRNKEGKTPKELWGVSSDQAWEILHGTPSTTTLDREAREQAGDCFPL